MDNPQLWRPLRLSSCLPGRWATDTYVLMYCWDTGLLCSSAYGQNVWRCGAFCDFICCQISSLFKQFLYFCFMVREISVWFYKAFICVSASVRPCMTPPEYIVYRWSYFHEARCDIGGHFPTIYCSVPVLSWLSKGVHRVSLLRCWWIADVLVSFEQAVISM